MAVHHEVLLAAQRLCAERGTSTFTPDEIVRALPHVNPRTVLTHVTSRCCVNAPTHHQSRLAYFRRTARGVYELLPAYRSRRVRPADEPRRQRAVALPQRETIHAILTKDGHTYVLECHEVPVVTQGRTVDEALANLKEAVSLHLEGEDLAELGLAGLTHIQVSYQLPAGVSAA